MTNQLTNQTKKPMEAGIEVTEAEAHAIAFFDLDGIGQAEIDNGFDQGEFVGQIIRDMRSDNPKVSQRAQEFFWRMKKEAAILTGRVAKGQQVTETVDDKGTKTRTTLAASGLLARIRGSNPHVSPTVDGPRQLIAAIKPPDEVTSSLKDAPNNPSINAIPHAIPRADEAAPETPTEDSGGSQADSGLPSN